MLGNILVRRALHPPIFQRHSSAFGANLAIEAPINKRGRMGLASLQVEG
jgi:hypothetical protein